MIALTFDDGPYLYTTQLLDILDSFGLKATFFVAGNNRAKGRIDNADLAWPAILRRMHAAGHHIASHTWTHRDLNRVNSTVRRTEMVYNEMALRNLFGWIPTYMRPPYLECSAGSGCQGLMNSLGYHVVNVNVDTKDFEFNDAALIQQAKDRFDNAVSLTPASNDYIVLAHDVQYQTVVNLTAHMVNTARDRGYRLVTVGECLGDPVENWYRAAPGEDGATSSSSSSTSSTSSTSTSRSLGSATIPAGPSATSPNVASMSSPSRPSASSTSASSTAALPTTGVTISPNQRCGGDTGFTCMGSRFGNCCSHYGYW
jgi:peptidoglycan/xylan/chitin deacetylase (PgdA/CDA1 family)